MTLAWTEQGNALGVRLRCTGAGAPVVVLPGLEGSGESCLHLVLPVVLPEGRSPRGQLWLVDYGQERAPSLGRLVEAVRSLLTAALGNRGPVRLWTQSFGGPLLARVLEEPPVEVMRTVLVSPFTRLAPGRVRLARASVAASPAPLLCALTKPTARLVFGPVGDAANAPFFAALAAASRRDLRRRLSFLHEADFTVPFTRLPGPVRVWLGAQDRLVDLSREMAFFQALARGSGGVRVLAGSGHVVLPTPAVAQARAEMAQWLDA